MPRVEPGSSDGGAAARGGRRFVVARRVGLGDATRSGRLRLDALACYLQDAAQDDAADAGAGGRGSGWVLRRLALDLGGDLPHLGDDVTLTTWCDGVGARWAERRTDLAVDGAVRARAVAVWVHVDLATGRPAPLTPAFHTTFGPSAAGRRADHRLRHDPPPPGRLGEPWPLRTTDFDVLGHMNNAAYWVVVEEALATRYRGRRLVSAEMEYRGGVEQGERLDVADDDRGDAAAFWFTVTGEPRASALVGFAGS